MIRRWWRRRHGTYDVVVARQRCGVVSSRGDRWYMRCACHRYTVNPDGGFDTSVAARMALQRHFFVGGY